MKRFVMAAALAFGAVAPAHADNRGDHHEHQSGAIAQARALEIAADQGVARVREVELRRGVWKVEGFTGEGRAIEVEINAHSGAVVKRELY